MSDSLPQPDDIPAREKEDAMGAYLMVFGALHLGLPLPFLGLLAALIYHFVNGKKSPFTGFHTYQSLLFSIPASVFSAVWVIWGIVILVKLFDEGAAASQNLTAFWVFSVFSLLVYLVYLVYSILGAVQSRKGRLIYFPIIGRLAYDRYYGTGRARLAKPEVRNAPPGGL